MAVDPGAQGSLADWARRTQEAITNTVRQLFPGVANPEDPGPVTSQWRQVPDHEPYIPEWTDPEWSPTVQFSGTGRRKRDVYVTTGEVMRPAILRRDVDKNPTDYARRFGIYPKTRPGDPDPAIGRSLVTPTIPRPDQPAGDGAYTVGEAEAWQSFVFLGPTINEMIDHRIYVPDYESNEPGLEGDLHPLLSRDRWIPRDQFRFSGFINNFRWKFGDEEGYYSTDDERVWEAIKPALKLVTRVINSNHPFWNAILSLYHLRPVPDHADGRTQRDRDLSGAPLPSIWLDENKPGLYREAEELRRLGFRSRETTEAILNHYLRFCIGVFRDSLDSQGISFTSALYAGNEGDESIAIAVHPSIIWQLMTTEFPETRMAATFNLASTMLHELSHACHFAHEFLLRKPDVILRAIRNVDLGITPEMASWFPRLRVSLLGRGDGNLDVDKQSWFFQDSPQCEEGRSFEQELWGLIPQIGHWRSNEGAGLTPLQAFIVGTPWPTSHLAVDLQHRNVDRSFYAPYATGDYRGFLLEPPAPVFNQDRPVPVDDYTQFSHETFWESQFSRFGAQALKLAPSQDALMILHPRGNRLIRTELIRELGAEDYNYFSTKVMPLLRNLEQHLLADWLSLETNDLVLEQVTHHRLHFEARTWVRTFGDIISILDKTITDINQIGAEITNRSAQYRQNWLTADLQQTIKTQLQQTITNFVTSDLLEGDRLVRMSIQYAQSLIALYALLPQPPQRLAVHTHHLRPLRTHLAAVRARLAACTRALDAFVAAAAGATFLAAEAQVLAGYAGPAADGARVSAARLADAVALLADDRVAPGLDHAARAAALPTVPVLRRRVAEREVYRRAAARALAYLNASDRSRASVAVSRWLAVLARHRGGKEGALEAYPVELDAAGVEPASTPGTSYQTARQSASSGDSLPRLPGGFPVSP